MCARVYVCVSAWERQDTLVFFALYVRHSVNDACLWVSEWRGWHCWELFFFFSPPLLLLVTIVHAWIWDSIRFINIFWHIFFQLLDTLPVCQDFNRQVCNRPACKFIHLSDGEFPARHFSLASHLPATFPLFLFFFLLSSYFCISFFSSFHCNNTLLIHWIFFQWRKMVSIMSWSFTRSLLSIMWFDFSKGRVKIDRFDLFNWHVERRKVKQRILEVTLSERMPPYSRRHKYSKRIECRHLLEL